MTDDMGSNKSQHSGGRLTGLSGQVLLLTIIFVMLGEVLIFLPSIANFRVQWMKTRIAQAEIAALALEASPTEMVPTDLNNALLMGAGVEAVAVMRADKRSLILKSENPALAEETFDLRNGSYYTAVIPAFRAMFVSSDRLINVIDYPPAMTGSSIEIAVHEWPLRDALINFALRILGVSIVLSFIVACLIYAALNRFFVRPMLKLSANMMAFGEMPEDKSRVIAPSGRGDELGMAERQLESMQKQLQTLLQQKTHLAALGLAVSKVSHDLRNMLTSAQLISDRLGEVKDARVQRFAPKLIISLNRAITFLNQTLTYGRAQELPPRREVFALKPLVTDVFETLQLENPRISLKQSVPAELSVDADREHLTRILTNLVRNAAQAIESRPQEKDVISVAASREGHDVRIAVKDSGPGIPPAVRGKLFQAFQTAARPGGTGLGLAISAELVQAHGGQIKVASSSEEGTSIEICLPDRNGQNGH
ncbi:sensor histidine kinase [Aestuariivirga litoralis]|uniref:sensor histidine kinase n=1 Tax=Aestuariivirga litoralis TaxID=2650924 RepID=UPI0018C514C4|nr:HAMP domain-containing sensor histidine kinase [Aestuariivirga litoralis]MBG1232572.1 HAMP domain-containing histidine kinase [Aestuariivirga litoralis]